jgi:hypothetical protein
MVDVSLFYSYFSSNPVVVLVIEGFPSHAVDHFVDAINCRFSDCPLLNDRHFYIFEFRSNAIIVLIRKNIVLSVEGHST